MQAAPPAPAKPCAPRERPAKNAGEDQQRERQEVNARHDAVTLRQSI